MKYLLTILFLLTFSYTSFPQNNSNRLQTSNLSYFEWYGKRFDWMLDIYGRHPDNKDSIHLFISEIGKGKDTFLVIHGGFGSEHSYLLDALLPLANEAHFIFYDQRGSLRSSCPDSVISVENHTNDIDRIRRAMKMDKINIIGHSMGTYLAMNYLQKYPGKAGKVILISSMPAKILNDEGNKTYSSHREKYFELLYAEQAKQWRLALQKNGLDTSTYRRSVLSQSKYLYMQQFWSAVGKISNYRNWDKDNNGNSFLFKANVAAVTEDMPVFWDFTESMRNHRYPIIIVKATRDYISPEIVKESVKGIKNVNYIEIENAGHNLWLEQPEKFRKTLLAAIKR